MHAALFLKAFLECRQTAGAVKIRDPLGFEVIKTPKSFYKLTFIGRAGKRAEESCQT